MPSIEKLKQEIARIKKDNERKEQRLRNFAESKREIKDIGREKKTLEGELKRLRNPKSTAFKRNVRRGIISGGKKTFNFLVNVAEAAEEDARRQQSRKRSPKKRASTKRTTTKKKSNTKKRGRK